jgi:CheY-like chemotaxis protein
MPWMKSLLVTSNAGFLMARFFGGFFQIQVLQKVPQIGVLKAIGSSNGAVGLEKAKSGGFDLALVDLKMPQMGGLELLEHLQRLDLI